VKEISKKNLKKKEGGTNLPPVGREIEEEC